MTIGLVLSKTPAYSETFFISKIKGLQEHGFRVILFVQHREPGFDVCEVKVAPKVYKKNLLKQLVQSFQVVISLLPYYQRLGLFMTLERKSHRTTPQLLKNMYTNAHILTSNVDWVHFGFATITLQSENVAKSIGARMAVSFRGFDLDVYPLTHANCYDLLWQRVDQVHSISQYLLQKAYILGLSQDTPAKVIKPAIDLNNFRFLPEDTSQPLQFLTIARLHWIKGIIETLEALAVLKQQGIVFQYKIIGTGPEFESIAFAIHQLKLDKEVELLGKIEHDLVHNYLANTDIYIQYSYSEGFCNAVLEAQAMGCLCVVSDGGALSENILNFETGFVVPKRNPRELAATLVKVINLSGPKKSEIIGNAKRRIATEFTIAQQQQAFIEFYESSTD